MKKLSLILLALIALTQGAWAQTTNVSNETDLRNAIVNDANITLTQDITIGSAITVGNGQTVTINLNNHTLNRGCTSRGSQVIGVYSGGTLYLSNGTVTGGWGGGGGGMFNEGTMHLTNVTITGNTADDRAGGISNNGTLTMTGCTVSNNTSRDAVDPAGGGGIFNYSGKTATLTNCTITGNTANTYGGGGICNYGTMTIENCSVTNNSANTTGGGIFNSTSGTLSINGCDITGNSAVSYGDGIYIDNSTLNMQGLCTVTGNTDSNIYLYGSGTKITVTGAFTSGSNIGVGVTDYGRKLTSGYSTYNSGYEPGEFFSMDNYQYGIGEKDGEAFPGVSYVERSWTGDNTTGHVVEETKVCTDYTTYSSNTNDNSLGGGWYLLSGTFTFNKRVTIDGDVKFILQDGCNVEFDKGIFIKENKTLTIYGQRDDSGYLWTDGSDGANGSIGGNEDSKGGNLVIHGGRIYAKPGSNNAAGIGGGSGSGSGMQSVTIWGGTVTAEGKSSGAGIGCGQENSNQPTVNIRGGSVTATGGSYAAGIGGGEECTNGTIHIWGGTITATGGHDAPGIGSGEEEDMNAYIYIYGGNITATGGENGAGIGSGEHGSLYRVIYIDGGTITAKGGKNAAGIGAGKNGDMTAHGVSITGGTIYATGGENGAGIGGGYNFIGHYDDDFMAPRKSRVTVSGGNVYATGGKKGAGIGTGYNDDDDRQNRCLKLEVSGGYVEAKSRGADAACIGGGTNVGGCYVEITGGTVKCIYTNEYSNKYDDKYPCQYIGRGGSDDDLYIRTVSLSSNYKVTKDGSKVLKDKRTSTCQSHPSGYSTIIIEPCEHEGSNYTIKESDMEKHTFSCNYCSGSDENHDGNPCSKCAYGSVEFTISFYEANADGNGYNSTPITYKVGYGVTFNLPECTTVPDNYVFKAWKKTDDEPNSIIAEDSELSSLESAGSSFSVTENVTYYARYISAWEGSGQGTASNPYQVATKDDWTYIVNKVNDGYFDYSGKYFKMTADIGTSDNPVTNMIGSSTDNAFRGNFDGDGHTLTIYYELSEDVIAPFRHTNGATISNLKTAGSIIAANAYVAGVVGKNYSESLTLYNVISSVDFTNLNIYTPYTGGLVGYAVNATIERCAFIGKFDYNNTVYVFARYYAGILSQKSDTNGSSVTIKDCLFAPSAVKVGDYSYTFAGGSTDKVTITNCYYTETCGTAQGTQAYTIESGTDDLWLYYGDLNYGDEDEAIAELQYFENKIFPFDNGLLYQKKFYTIGTANVTFTPVIPGYIATGLSASAGSLTDNLDYTFTLAMNSANSTINATGRTAAVIRVVDEAPYWDSISTGWVFISSPLTDATMPTTVYGLVPEIESRYDLYQLNPSTTKWENWKVGDNTNVNPGFDLVNGKGYLYATKDGTTLVFTGTFNNESTKTIENLPVGFNLVGNPFTVAANINKPYYTLNSDGSAVQTETSSDPIPPCHGVIVQATSANDSVVFTRATQQSAVPSNSGLNIALTQANTRGASTGSAALLDNAIITFNEGSQLGKFYFGKQNANIYIPQGGQEYAIAFSDGQGEMPLNFKAKENGTYTLSVNPEGAEMGYLHLIDNMTGADIDLLQMPTYTFTAKTSDYASRFRLVFAAQSSEASEGADPTFAFFSNGNWIILNEGKATLQIIDINGRILSNETVNGSVSKAINAAHGVYMLRLINGNDVKVQKVVVR